MPRGGKRPGAGRKTSAVTTLKNEALASLADAVFEKVNKTDEWTKVFIHGDARTKLQALMYLEDRQHGRPVPNKDGSKKEPITVRIEFVGNKAS